MKGTIMILAILASSFVHYLLGWLWYSPLLFAKPWMTSMNITQEQIHNQTSNQHMTLALTGSFIIGLIQTMVIAFCIKHFGISSMGQAVLFAGTMSFTFNFLSLMRSFLWIPKEFVVILVNAGYNFVGSMIIATILFLMIG